MSHPTWQLYLFSLLFLAVGIFCHFRASCRILLGSCDDVEMFTVKLCGVYALWTGVLFSSLTYSIKGQGPKLKRLAFLAINGMVAYLVVVMMLGSTNVGGHERTWMHLGDMIVSFIMLAILATVTMDDSEVAGAYSPFSVLGINAKTFVLLLTVSVFAEMVCYTDFVKIGYFVDISEPPSELARLILMMAAVIEFVLLLAYVFALLYGDNKDHEVTTVATLVMLVVTVLSFIGSYGLFKAGMFTVAIISIAVLFLLGIGALLGGRRSGYEAVGSSV